MVNFSLEGKVALVTGGAYGIGFAMAEALAQAGAKIAFNCRSQKHLDDALADYKAKGIDAKGYICDVTDEEAVKVLVAQIEKELGVIDILVNNAGIIKRIPMCDMTVDEFRQVVDIDLTAPFIMAKAVIPGMIKKGHGKIINVCSMMSELGRETVSAYAAAKGGLKMLTRNIASEYGEYNIQCNGIGPGYIATPQTAPFIMAKAVIPGMIKKGHGKIINVCSMMSELGRETVSAYAAAKGGLKMLTRNIASEYGEYNIQCNGIGPGYIATPQTAPLRERQADGSRHPFDSFIVSKTPAARWGTPEDLMGPTVFLASDASDFVNGHILYVDGGILAYIGKQPK